MRLGGRLAAAIEVLEDVERRHRPVAEALKDWGLSHRFAGAGDRAAIGNIAYDALRRLRSSSWRLDSDSPRAAAIGALLSEMRLAPEALNAALDGDRFAPAPLSNDELALLSTRDLASVPPAVQADCPDWCAPLLEEAFGPGWQSEGRALAERPPLDIRANTLKADRAKVLGELAGTGAAATRLAPDGIRIPPIEGDGRHPNVQAEPAFQKGWFEIQDEGSQIVARLTGAQPGMQVLDFCAGAGGKTLALSAQMDNRGQIFAYDAEKARLAPIFERLRRNENRNVQVASRPDELAPHRGQMDLVLVDAPCTGSGTWRRRPDAKWRLSRRQLDARLAEQASILDAASEYVRPGGRLAYVTCSFFSEENRSQLENFLARKTGFAPVNHAALWNDAFPTGAGAARVDADAGVLLSPGLSGTDGFYFAAVARL